MDARRRPDPAPAKAAAPRRRADTPIVPRNSIAGRALVAVVAIMTFLATLTTGAVMLVQAAASEWQADVAREMTIQIRPVSGRDIEADVRRAAEIARALPGVAEVRAYSREESTKLLEPWLGTGLSMDDLPVPRMIVVRLGSGARIDTPALQKTLTAVSPGAVLDDHRGWVERMRTMTGTLVAGGMVVLLLVLIATILSVTFATRGAMAANRSIVEVLHFVGATHAFIVSQFQRHFLVLGLEGGAIGGVAAIVLFLIADGVSRWMLGHEGREEIAALFGSFSIGFAGYLVMALQVVLVSIVTAATSRHTVNVTLRAID